MPGPKKKAKSEKPGEKTIATNRRARFEYEVLDSFEAGLALLGPEVKALREGKANIGDAFAMIRNGEAFLQKFHIGSYDHAARENADPLRPRKLLLMVKMHRALE